MLDFNAKKHQIRFPPQTPLGELTALPQSAPPDPLVVFKGPTSKGREWEWGREGKGRERERKGRGGEGKGRKSCPTGESGSASRREGRGREERGGKGEEGGDYHPHWRYDNLAALSEP